MRRARLAFWRAIAIAAAVVNRWAAVRGARACGCENCRLAYDPAARQAAADAIVARLMGSPPPIQRDRRPS